MTVSIYLLGVGFLIGYLGLHKLLKRYRLDMKTYEHKAPEQPWVDKDDLLVSIWVGAEFVVSYMLPILVWPLIALDLLRRQVLKYCFYHFENKE